MTPGARAAAAMALLDEWLEGEPAERALTRWARASRYAGSGDRAAVRDLVFDAIRHRRSAAQAGGAETGRGLVLGLLRMAREDPAALFAGDRYAPPLPAAGEMAQEGEAPPLVQLDCPDWLAPRLEAALGSDFAAVMARLRERAPAHLRVNLRKASVADAAEALRAEGIETIPHPLAETALEVVKGARRIAGSAAYHDGQIELQDAASQAVAASLDVPPGGRVLDVCAGGGGKTLALAARADAQFFAHDVEPRRMKDIPARAARAGVEVQLLEEPEAEAPFDLVLADAPCSGSGAWRRSPEAKWRLTPERLAELCALQATILDRAARLLAPGGTLAYATCSLLAEENEAAIAGFIARSGFRPAFERRISPLEGGDGFYLALLTCADRRPTPLG